MVSWLKKLTTWTSLDVLVLNITSLIRRCDVDCILENVSWAAFNWNWFVKPNCRFCKNSLKLLWVLAVQLWAILPVLLYHSCIKPVLAVLCGAHSLYCQDCYIILEHHHSCAMYWWTAVLPVLLYHLYSCAMYWRIVILPVLLCHICTLPV